MQTQMTKDKMNVFERALRDLQKFKEESTSIRNKQVEDIYRKFDPRMLDLELVKGQQDLLKDQMQAVKEHINEINRELNFKLSHYPPKRSKVPSPATMSGAPSSEAFINTMD